VADAERIFKKLIDQAVGEALKGVAEQIQATLNPAVLSVGLDNSRLTGVAINRYGILVQLQVTTPPATRLNPILGIQVDQHVTDLGIVGSGTQTGVTCNADTAYAYQDRHRWTTVTLTAIPQALGDQVTYEWTVNGDDVDPGSSEQFVPARTYDGSELSEPGRIQRLLSPNGVQLTINHSPLEGNLNLFVQCVARNASGREATAARYWPSPIINDSLRAATPRTSPTACATWWTSSAADRSVGRATRAIRSRGETGWSGITSVS
jgi:hypothetical protein